MGKAYAGQDGDGHGGHAGGVSSSRRMRPSASSDGVETLQTGAAAAPTPVLRPVEQSVGEGGFGTGGDTLSSSIGDSVSGFHSALSGEAGVRHR